MALSNVPIRAIICPIIISIFVILHSIFPWRLPSLLPKLWTVQLVTDLETRLRSLPKPISLWAALRLGRLIEQLDTASNPDEAAILEEASTLCKQPIGNVAHLSDIETGLRQLEEHATIMHRIRGAFSLVNFLWLVSIVGLAVTLWPTLTLIGGRIMHIVSQWFVTYVLPVLIRFNRWGVFEVLFYVICLTIVAQAARYRRAMGEGAPGSYVALTAVAFFVVAYNYTIHLHYPFRAPTSSDYSTIDAEYAEATYGSDVYRMGSAFATATLIPLAILHKSELLGFLGVWQLQSVLGFVCGAMPFGYYVGFQSKYYVDRCALASLLLVITFVSIRFFKRVNKSVLKPFHLGVMVMGNFAYFLALLIRSGYFYESNHRYYILAQIVMVVSLVVALAVGRIFDIASMNNTATTFGVLYLTEKIYELPLGQWVVVFIFIGFGCLYFLATFLRTHPGYLRSLFDPSGLLD